MTNWLDTMTFEYFLAIENTQRTKPSWQRMNKQTNYVYITFATHAPAYITHRYTPLHLLLYKYAANPNKILLQHTNTLHFQQQSFPPL